MLIRLSLILIVLSGCTDSSTEHQFYEDSFYNVGGEYNGDIPLIKPYVIRYIDFPGDSLWDIPLFQDHEIYYSFVHELEKFAVRDSVIYAKSGYAKPISEGIPFLKWFILEVDKGIETAFEDERDFKKFIQENNLPIPEKWLRPKKVLADYNRTGKLPWKPNK